MDDIQVYLDIEKTIRISKSPWRSSCSTWTPIKSSEYEIPRGSRPDIPGDPKNHQNPKFPVEIVQLYLDIEY